MEKNSTILLMLVLIVICWFGIFKFSGMAVIYLGDSMAYAGRNLIVERINADSAIIAVDGEKDLFEIGETKIINGIEIKVSAIIYFPEKEDRRVELNLDSLTVCSDGLCELGEDPENCCIDCGCQANYVCEDNICGYKPADQCKTDTDCDDLNMSTKDLCFGDPKACRHQTIQCYSDSTCNDNDECTKDWCSFNTCLNQPIEGCRSTIFSRKTEPQEKPQGFLNRLIAWLFG